MADATIPAPETRRIGKYVVKRELGRGGMGTVYLAEQPGLGREVAIKELIVSSAADATALARFLQEARVMARTSHPNLVQVHDMEQVGDANYLILEFVRGQSLRDFANQGEIPLPQVFAVLHAVLMALDYAHKHSIVHRDMKPENVLISDEGDVKVADFGIARLTDESGGSSSTRSGTTVGTPQYMSPEQVASSKVDGRSDLYSAGIMLYELVCGRPPFTADEAAGPFVLMAKQVQSPPPPPSLYLPEVDGELEEIMLRSLAKRPEERYQTGEQFDEALIRVADRLAPGWQKSLQNGGARANPDPGPAEPVAPPQAGTGVQVSGPVAPSTPLTHSAPSGHARGLRSRAGCLGALIWLAGGVSGGVWLAVALR